MWTKNLIPQKLTFRFEDDIKSFHDKQKLKEFTNRKRATEHSQQNIPCGGNGKQQCKSAKGGTTLKQRPIKGDTNPS